MLNKLLIHTKILSLLRDIVNKYDLFSSFIIIYMFASSLHLPRVIIKLLVNASLCINKPGVNTFRSQRV